MDVSELTLLEADDGIMSDSAGSLDTIGQTKVKHLTRSRFDEKFKYKQIRALGHGGNGNCFLLERRSDKELRVVKVVHGLGNRKDTVENREVKILRDVLPQNERILRIYEVIHNVRTSQLYFEYCSGGDLSALIRHYRSRHYLMPESFIWHAFIQMTQALSFIHHGYDRRLGWLQDTPADWVSVIHSDIKPENIFLKLSADSSYPSLVLGDFGAATLKPGTEWVGTYQWQPPEIPEYSTKADVWSMGAVIHAMALGMPPIAPLPKGYPPSIENWEAWMRSPNSRSLRPLLDYSEELEGCMFEALRFDPDLRSSSLEVLFSVYYEVNMGVASEDIFEPLLQDAFKGKASS